MAIKLLKVTGICVVIGLSFGLYMYFAYDRQLARILNSVISNVTIGCLMMLCIYNSRYLNLISQVQYIKVSLLILMLIFAALAGSELTLFFQSLLYGSNYVFLNGDNLYFLNILIVLVIGIPIYVSEESKSSLHSKLVNQQLQLLQLEQQNTRFELELLRAKVNPHFLYNVHNSIAGLISKDPGKAETMVMLLSRFFRFTLNKGNTTFHTLADEAEIIKTYLDMQQIRYDERLSYSIDLKPADMLVKIPSYILQPLVENAIKHGAEKISGKGIIIVGIEVSSEHVRIRVEDNGPPFPEQPGSGTGLQLVHHKLKLLYKENFKMEFYNTPKKYVELILPKDNKDGPGR